MRCPMRFGRRRRVRVGEFGLRGSCFDRGGGSQCADSGGGVGLGPGKLKE